MNIIDITDPANAHQIMTLSDKECLQSVTDVDAIVTKDRTLAVVAGYRTDTIAVLDIANPQNPLLLSTVQGSRDGPFLHGPESAQVAVIGDGIFVAVANGNNSMQLIDITDPFRPRLASATGTIYDTTTYGVTGVEMVTAGPDTYVLFQTIYESITNILDATDPYGVQALEPIPPLYRVTPFR